MSFILKLVIYFASNLTLNNYLNWDCKLTWVREIIYFASDLTPNNIKLDCKLTWSEITNSNPLGPFRLSSQSTEGVRVLLCALPASQHIIWWKNCWAQNHFAEPNQYVLIFLHSIFCRWGHILWASPVELLLYLLWRGRRHWTDCEARL